jgi:hypothetical protein
MLTQVEQLSGALLDALPTNMNEAGEACHGQSVKLFSLFISTEKAED